MPIYKLLGTAVAKNTFIALDPKKPLLEQASKFSAKIPDLLFSSSPSSSGEEEGNCCCKICSTFDSSSTIPTKELDLKLSLEEQNVVEKSGLVVFQINKGDVLPETVLPVVPVKSRVILPSAAATSSSITTTAVNADNNTATREQKKDEKEEKRKEEVVAVVEKEKVETKKEKQTEEEKVVEIEKKIEIDNLSPVVSQSPKTLQKEEEKKEKVEATSSKKNSPTTTSSNNKNENKEATRKLISSLLEHDIQDRLECQLCGRHYDTVHVVPVLLVHDSNNNNNKNNNSCNCDFCRECVESQQKSKNPSKICRNGHEIKNWNVKTVTSKRILKLVVDRYCAYHDDQEITSYCLSCRSPTCSFCNLTHEKDCVASTKSFGSVSSKMKKNKCAPRSLGNLFVCRELYSESRAHITAIDNTIERLSSRAIPSVFTQETPAQVRKLLEDKAIQAVQQFHQHLSTKMNEIVEKYSAQRNLVMKQKMKRDQAITRLNESKKNISNSVDELELLMNAWREMKRERNNNNNNKNDSNSNINSNSKIQSTARRRRKNDLKLTINTSFSSSSSSSGDDDDEEQQQQQHQSAAAKKLDFKPEPDQNQKEEKEEEDLEDDSSSSWYSKNKLSKTQLRQVLAKKASILAKNVQRLCLDATTTTTTTDSKNNSPQKSENLENISSSSSSSGGILSGRINCSKIEFLSNIEVFDNLEPIMSCFDVIRPVGSNHDVKLYSIADVDWKSIV